MFPETIIRQFRFYLFSWIFIYLMIRSSIDVWGKTTIYLKLADSILNAV